MSTEGAVAAPKGRIFNIQRYSTDDGPGIRTTVFLKGCPLTCLWCANPESQNRFREVGHRDALCNQCGLCVKACTSGAISLKQGAKGVSIDRALCSNCGDCVGVCAEGALVKHGQDLSVEEVLDEVKRDRTFYRNTGGGVTASGGEPLSQSAFVAALFQRCRQTGIHTAIETSGYASRAALDRVLKHTDLLLYDLKCMDNDDTIVRVGQPNKLILSNAEYVMKSDTPVIIRIPLIPGITDSAQNLRDIAEFVKAVNPETPINVLPYHRLGISKFRMLDRDYELTGLAPLPEGGLAHAVEIFESMDLKCEAV